MSRQLIRLHAPAARAAMRRMAVSRTSRRDDCSTGAEGGGSTPPRGIPACHTDGGDATSLVDGSVVEDGDTQGVGADACGSAGCG